MFKFKIYYNWFKKKKEGNFEFDVVDDDLQFKS